MIAVLSGLLAITLQASTSLLYAALGEIYTERSGILNLGIEGTMLLSAALSFATVYYSSSLLLGVLVAMLVGMTLSAIHAFLSVPMRANQVVSGLSITIFGTGLASFVGQRLGPTSNSNYLAGLTAERFTRVPIPVLSDIPILGVVFNQDILTYALYLLVPLLWFVLFRTRPGIRLRAAGEDPRAADAMGVSVSTMRIVATLFGGAMSGIGGAHLSLAYTPGWAENLSGGRGWIAVALVIFAMWSPYRAVFGALIFGGINAIQFRMQAGGTVLPSAFLNMLPYLFTIGVLILMTLRNRAKRIAGAPSALGTSYTREIG